MEFVLKICFGTFQEGGGAAQMGAEEFKDGRYSAALSRMLDNLDGPENFFRCPRG